MIALNDIRFTSAESITLAVLMLCFLYQVYFYFRYIHVVLARKRANEHGKIVFQKEKFPVSVIICARDEDENLRRYLPDILTQNYPEYEVIVVNDGGSEETEILLREFKKIYPRLRSTFVPDGTTNLSPKKLALTLGIKAARYDWLLMTDADCIPESKNWIANIARNFVPGTEFVLGYGAYFRNKGFLNKMITYDTLFNALQYLGFARSGKPYMGVGRNLAYRKEVFFRQKGFASTLHLRSGDDDLMVNHAANKHNTRVETSSDSVTWSLPKKTFRSWYYQKERHLSVSPFYKTGSKLALLFEPLSRGMFYLSLIVLILLSLSPGNSIPVFVAAGLFLLRFLMQVLIVNRTSMYLKGERYFFGLLIFDIVLPVITLFIMLFGRMGKQSGSIKWK